MPHARLATIGSELIANVIGHMTGSKGFWTGDEWDYQVMQRSADKLQQADVVAASLAKAHLAELVGDWTESLRWIENMHRNGAHEDATRTKFVVCANLGFVEDAAAAFEAAATFPPRPGTCFAAGGLICASYSSLIRALERDRAANIELSDEEDKAIMKASSATAVLDRLGLSEADVRAMLSVAGEVVRERQIFWQEPLPRITVVEAEDELGILYEFALPVSTEEAFALTDAVVDRLVDANLDRAGLALTFVPSI